MSQSARCERASESVSWTRPASDPRRHSTLTWGYLPLSARVRASTSLAVRSARIRTVSSSCAATYQAPTAAGGSAVGRGAGVGVGTAVGGGASVPKLHAADEDRQDQGERARHETAAPGDAASVGRVERLSGY